MATKLMGLSLDELSFVDRPANKAARVSIFKRDDDGYTSIEKGDLPDEVVEYLKREFSGKEREHLASTGAAMPGGGFPIKSVQDLRNAVRAIGRAKNPAAAKAHIISRAKTLGATSELPEDWTKSLKGETMDPQKEIEALKAQVADLTSKLDAAVKAEAASKATIDELKKQTPPVDANGKPIDKEDAKDQAADEAAEKKFSDAVKAEVEKRMKAVAEDEIIKIADPSDAAKTRDIRKSEVGESNFAMFKSQQAEIKKANDARELVELTKQAEAEYGNLTGTSVAKAEVLKAMKGMPEETRKTLDAMLKSGNAAIKKTMSPIGQDGGGNADSPDVKLEGLVNEYAQKNSVSKAVAYDNVLKTDVGKALYRESLGTPKAA